MKYYGTFEDLKEIICKAGHEIKSSTLIQSLPQHKQIKTYSGAVVTWYETTGTILVQGARDAKQKLEVDLRLNIEEVKSQIPAAEPVEGSSFKLPEVFAPESSKTKNKIFIVHGHDHSSLRELELLLLKLGIEACVLQNNSSDGLTIIEALEKEICTTDGPVNFGIVLLTPDDMGYAKSDGAECAQPRARQNVVFEMGMLIATFKRKNVVILKKQHLEIPSDAQGIIYLEFKEHVKEVVTKLADRLQKSGFSIEADALIRASQ
ncbi:TIR domain-containing protein [Bartonella sp. B30(2025)]